MRVAPGRRGNNASKSAISPSTVAAPEKKKKSTKLSSDTQESTHKVPKFASQVIAYDSRVPLAPSRGSPNTSRHASRLVHDAMSAWSAKTRCAPPRYYRATTVNGHTATATHEMSIYTPPPPAPSRAPAHHLSIRSFLFSEVEHLTELLGAHLSIGRDDARANHGVLLVHVLPGR